MTPEATAILVSGVMLVFGLLVLGGVGIAIAGMRYRAQTLEIQHRERLALIEKGIVPPSPGGPDAFGWHEQRRSVAGQRLLSIGILFIGLGFALAVVIGLTAGHPDVGIGIGGGIAILGAAFAILGLLNSRQATWHHPPTPGGVPPPPPRSTSSE